MEVHWRSQWHTFGRGTYGIRRTVVVTRTLPSVRPLTPSPSPARGEGRRRVQTEGEDSSQADDLSSEQQSRRGRKSEDGKKKSPESWVSNPQFAIRNPQCLKPERPKPDCLTPFSDARFTPAIRR